MVSRTRTPRVTCIPSLNHPELVPDFVARLAGALGLPFVPCIEKTMPQAAERNGKQFPASRDLDGAFTVTNRCLPDEGLLIDDVVDPGWTFTMASAILYQAGCSAVYTLALALNSPGMY